MLGGEVGREDVAEVLGEGEGEERGDGGGEGDDGLGVEGEGGVDAAGEGDADRERGLLDAPGVEAQEGGEEDVEEERGGAGVRGHGPGRGAGAGEAGVDEVEEVGGVPAARGEAGADDGAEVGQVGELRGVLRLQDEAERVDGAGRGRRGVPRAGGGEQVGVDLDLGVRVEGQAGVEGGDAGVEGRVARDEGGLGRAGKGGVGGRSVEVPLGESAARRQRQQALDPQVCSFVKGLEKSS